VVLSKTHRLLVPAGLNGAVPVNPALHFLGVQADAGSYDVSTTRARMFSTSLGTVTFKPGTIRFFYDPLAKSLSAQFGTQHPSLTRLDYACVDVSLSGPAPAEAWIVCFNQKTKDALNPPNVILTTQDLGQFSDMRVDPLDEVCVQAQVQ
jgi:hypothetical protein